MERSVTETVPCIDRSATVQQECDDPNEIVSDSFVKRSGTLAIAFTPRTPAVEKKRGHLNVAVLASHVKRSAPTIIPCIDRTGTAQQEFDDPNMVASDSVVNVFTDRSATVEKKRGNLNILLPTSSLK